MPLDRVRALAADAAHRRRPLLQFSLDFLPHAKKDWEVADCHGGIVLLRELRGSPPNLIVCDPLARRYQRIRRLSEKQLGLGHVYAANAFLVDGEDGGGISISNFRVLHRVHQILLTWVFVFVSTADGAGWRFLRQSTGDGDYWGHVAGRVDGSTYVGLATGKVRVLDNASLEFSDVGLPIPIVTLLYGSAFTVVHGAGPNPTSPPTTWIIHARCYGEALEFFCLVRGGGGGAWVLEHSIPQLAEAMRRLLRGRSEALGWTAVDVIAGGTGIAVVSARDGNNRR